MLGYVSYVYDRRECVPASSDHSRVDNFRILISIHHHHHHHLLLCLLIVADSDDDQFAVVDNLSIP